MQLRVSYSRIDDSIEQHDRLRPILARCERNSMHACAEVRGIEDHLTVLIGCVPVRWPFEYRDLSVIEKEGHICITVWACE